MSRCDRGGNRTQKRTTAWAALAEATTEGEPG